MYKDRRIVGIIPARSGSQTIKNKNLQRVGKHSLLGRSIFQAKESEYLDEIFVSTNGEEIKKEARLYGTKTIDRPEEISGPLSSTEEAMLHAVEHVDCDYIVVLQPTSPFRSEGLIDRCIERIVDQEGDSLLTGWKFHNFCFYKIVEDGIWISTFDYVDRPMSQQLTEIDFRWFDCGNIYITKMSFLKERKCRLGGKIIIEPVSTLECMQIDGKEELETCQRITNGEIS